MNKNWIILDRDGNPIDTATLPERPADSREKEEDNEYTPWYRQEEHIHVENGKIDGIHARGNTTEVKKLLNYCLRNESKIIQHFGSREDNIILVDVLKFMAIQ